MKKLSILMLVLALTLAMVACTPDGEPSEPDEGNQVSEPVEPDASQPEEADPNNTDLDNSEENNADPDNGDENTDPDEDEILNDDPVEGTGEPIDGDGGDLDGDDDAIAEEPQLEE